MYITGRSGRKSGFSLQGRKGYLAVSRDETVLWGAWIGRAGRGAGEKVFFSHCIVVLFGFVRQWWAHFFLHTGGK